MNTPQTEVSHRAEELDAALAQASIEGFGFVDDFAPQLLDPLRDLSDYDPNDKWQVLDPGALTQELMTLRGIILARTQALDPRSNLDFVHILHRAGGGTHWHRDVSKDDALASGYEKGRFRAGYNLFGEVEIQFVAPGDQQETRLISPGALYVMDLTFNPRHRSQPADIDSSYDDASKVLLMTDVARLHCPH